MWQAIFSKSFELRTESVAFHLQYDRKFNQPFVNLNQNDSWKSFSVVRWYPLIYSCFLIRKQNEKAFVKSKKEKIQSRYRTHPYHWSRKFTMWYILSQIKINFIKFPAPLYSLSRFMHVLIYAYSAYTHVWGDRVPWHLFSYC